jgi:hypothetical protein
LQANLHELSSKSLSNDQRAALLRALVLEGRIGKFIRGRMVTVGYLLRPVAHYRNFLTNSGQIRTDQFLNKMKKTEHVVPGTGPYPVPGVEIREDVIPESWTLREYRLQSYKNALLAVPAPVSTTIAREVLADKELTDELQLSRARLLHAYLVKALPALLGGAQSNGKFIDGADITKIGLPSKQPSLWLVPFESNSSKQERGDILDGYNKGLATLPGFVKPLSQSIAMFDSKLPIGSTLSIGNLVDRLRTQSCAGCHQFSDTKKSKFGFDESGALGLGAVWPSKACGDISPNDCAAGLDFGKGAGSIVKDELSPASHPPMQFTHISELILTKSVGDSGAGWRYSISTTAECLLNVREARMRALLNIGGMSSSAPCSP